MTGNRIKKITAFILMLVFSQKMGMSLYLHNWLHTGKQLTATSTPVSNEEIKFACSCISDFTLPVSETAVMEIPLPGKLVMNPVSSPAVAVPRIYKYFHSLRAPPVVS